MVVDRDAFLADCVKIEPAALQEEFVRLPGDFAYWAEQHALATESFLTAEAGRKHEEARLYLLAGQKVNPATGKSYTIDGVKALVETDPSFQAAKHVEVQAEVELARAKNVMEALRTKREALISLGATIRQEMQTDPLVRDRSRR